MAHLLKSASVRIRRFAFDQPRVAIGTAGLGLIVSLQLLVAIAPGRML